MEHLLGIKQVTREFYLKEQLTGNTIGYLWLVNNKGYNEKTSGTYDIYFGNRHYGTTNDIFNKSIINSIGNLLDENGSFVVPENFITIENKNLNSLSDIFYAIDKSIDVVKNDINSKLSLIALKNISVDDKILKVDSNGVVSSSLKFEKKIIENEEFLVLFGNDDIIIGKIPTSDFKLDGMLENVEFSQKEGKNNILVLTFNTSSGKKPIEIDFSKYVDIYKGDENTILIDNNIISIKENVFDLYGSSESVKKDLTEKINIIANSVVNKNNLKSINELVLLKDDEITNISIIDGASTEITTNKNNNTIQIDTKISKKEYNAAKILNDGLFVPAIYLEGDDVDGNIIITNSKKIENNGIYDGEGNTLSITETINDNIIIKGEQNIEIKNVIIDGNNTVTNDDKSLRAIFVTNPENIAIDNVYICGVGYAFNTLGSNNNAIIEIKNSTLIGWTSFDPVKSAKFSNVHFGIGSYYENNSMFNGGIRPYSTTILENCSFDKNFYISTIKLDEKETITLKNCIVNNSLVINKENIESYIKIEGDLNKIIFI